MVGGAREAELQHVPAPAVGVALQVLHPAPGPRGRALRREARRDGDGIDLVAEGTVMQFALDFTQKLAPAAQERIADGMRQADENADCRWRHIFDGCVLAAAR